MWSVCAFGGRNEEEIGQGSGRSGVSKLSATCRRAFARVNRLVSLFARLLFDAHGRGQGAQGANKDA